MSPAKSRKQQDSGTAHPPLSKILPMLPPRMSGARSRQRSREGQRPSPPDKSPTLSTPCPLTCTAQDEQSQVPAAAGQLDLANGRQQSGEEALGVEAEGGQLAGHRVRGGPGRGRGNGGGGGGGGGGPSSLENKITAGLNRGRGKEGGRDMRGCKTVSFIPGLKPDQSLPPPHIRL